MMLAGIPPRTGGTSGHGLGACSVFGHRATEGRRRCEMKGRLVAFVGIFCIAILVVSGANADKPPKEPKPPRPVNIAVECITFSGPDLVGRQQVEDCCPNAGPFPVYRLTLPNGFGSHSPGTYDGELFMNSMRVGQNRQYLVQFTGDCIDCGLEDHISIEIRGGVIDYDKKTKVLTVTFTRENCMCTEMCDTCQLPFSDPLDFTLVRTSDLSDCPVVDDVDWPRDPNR